MTDYAEIQVAGQVLDHHAPSGTFSGKIPLGFGQVDFTMSVVRDCSDAVALAAVANELADGWDLVLRRVLVSLKSELDLTGRGSAAPIDLEDLNVFSLSLSDEGEGPFFSIGLDVPCLEQGDDYFDYCENTTTGETAVEIRNWS